MANDSQRDKARATFGKTFFENSKALPNPKNAAAALQKRANDRPIPTYKVGGVVKKPTPPGPTAAEREEARRQNESLRKAKVTKKEGQIIDSANRSEGGMKSGGKAMAGAKSAMRAEQDFTGLMKKAADRAAAKGTPVMKDGGPTNEYTAKRVMARIKAGNFAEGGEAKDRMEARMRKAEMAYKIALAKGKNEGIAKAKFERRNADIADDYAKKTGADRAGTKAAEQAAKAALKEARRTKGESIAKRDFDKSMMEKSAGEIKQFSAGKKKMPDVSETLKGISAMPSAEAPKAAPAKAKARVSRPAAPVTPRAASQTITPPAAPPTPPAAPAKPAPQQPKPQARKSPVNAGRSEGFLSGLFKGEGKAGESSSFTKSQEKKYGRSSKADASSINANRSKNDYFSKFVLGTSKDFEESQKKKYGYAAGGAAKVRKGMMKGK